MVDGSSVYGKLKFRIVLMNEMMLEFSLFFTTAVKEVVVK